MADWERARREYPSVGMDADEIYERLDREPEIMWRILYDVFDFAKREEERERGEVRLGRRPKRPATREEILAEALPEPWTNDPFPEALRKLMKGRSQRAFAKRMGVSQSRVNYLVNGELEPDLFLLECAAEAGGVPPWFFKEWRALWLAKRVAEVLDERPQLSVTYLRRLEIMP